MKVTAQAPSNIAFIKYWGLVNADQRIPANSSISMNLDNLKTVTTLEFSNKYLKDNIIINGTEAIDREKQRVVMHLDRIRDLAKISVKAKVVSINNFPSSSGLSSSASGFAALTLAATKAAGLNLKEKELSILARLASGSACRSIPDGFVEWKKGSQSDDSYAISLYPKDYWDIIDVVAVLSNIKKYTPTSYSMKLAQTSVFYRQRISQISKKIFQIKKYLQEKNFTKFGQLIENEAMELHAVIMTQSDTPIYLLPPTLKLMQKVRDFRSIGLEVYFTINTGHDLHLLCRKKDESQLLNLLQKENYVIRIISNKPCNGARIIDKHNF
jgi:diphosphomevalonate decarboxylase